MNRLLCFPHTYVIIDIEMTGLEPAKDSIIEIAGLRIIDDTIESTFSSLLKPSEYVLKEEITQLTGITEEMLSTAPHFSEIQEELTAFIGKLPFVGHNILLDIQFLNKAMLDCGYSAFDNDYVDTLPLSQKLFPEFIHHRLTDMAAYYNISTEGAHRALQDCYITKSCFDAMRKTMTRSFPTEEAFTESFSTTGKRLKAEHIKPFYQITFPKVPMTQMESSSLCQAFIQHNIFQQPIQSPIQNKVFVFTGILKQMSRREAMLWVASLGGINEDKLTTKVNYLVVGWKEAEIVNNDHLSGKEKKALRYQAEGYPIQILTEQDFITLIIGTQAS